MRSLFSLFCSQKKSSDDMDLADHRCEATRIQTRRSIPLGSRAEVPTPQEDKAGPLEHSRLGLVGWIVYWSLGNSALALKIIVGLIRKLDMTDSVFEALTPIAMTREAETNAKIVMLMKAGLAETKHCRNEQQRQEFHIGLDLDITGSVSLVMQVMTQVVRSSISHITRGRITVAHETVLS